VAYAHGPSTGASKELRWVDRNGKPIEEVGRFTVAQSASLSPDGRSIAAVRLTGDFADIWVFDIARQTSSRLTFGGGDHSSPRWSPDSREIAVSLNTKPFAKVLRIPANGVGKEIVAAELPDRNISVGQWTADGKYLIVSVTHGPTGESPQPDEIWSVPLGGGKPFPLIATSFHVNYGRVSPDGKWIAYTGLATGSSEAYIQDLPLKRDRWQVSSGGGTRPMWRADSRELIYSHASEVKSVEIQPAGGKLQPGVTTVLFELPAGDTITDISPDARRLLVSFSRSPAPASGSFTVLLNWPAALKR
jgi:dipeptidyl aminopeptidase/acylaminoacyl peptidase